MRQLRSLSIPCHRDALPDSIRQTLNALSHPPAELRLAGGAAEAMYLGEVYDAAALSGMDLGLRFKAHGLAPLERPLLNAWAAGAGLAFSSEGDFGDDGWLNSKAGSQAHATALEGPTVCPVTIDRAMHELDVFESVATSRGDGVRIATPAELMFDAIAEACHLHEAPAPRGFVGGDWLERRDRAWSRVGLMASHFASNDVNMALLAARDFTSDETSTARRDKVGFNLMDRLGLYAIQHLELANPDDSTKRDLNGMLKTNASIRQLGVSVDWMRSPRGRVWQVSLSGQPRTGRHAARPWQDVGNGVAVRPTDIRRDGISVPEQVDAEAADAGIRDYVFLPERPDIVQSIERALNELAVDRHRELDRKAPTLD